MSEKRVYNFAAGPAALPEEVLKEAQKELLNYKGCGRSVMELSHRSKIFDEIIKKAESDLRTLLKIPDNYKVLFMQGGGTAQFSCIPMNLLGDKKKCAYAVTGSWSQKAFNEAKKYGEPILACKGIDGKFIGIPDEKSWQIDEDIAYLYYCSNETVDGVEFQDTPKIREDIILVADMSSNFLSRPIEVSRHGCIIAGAQKNCGIAGVTIVIVREDLLGRALPTTPTILNYKTLSDNNSLYNTPPTFGIYMSGLVFKWLIKLGGLEEMEKINIQKSDLIYDLLKSGDFYQSTVKEGFRSRMNITFRLKDKSLEEQFIKETTEKGMIELKGHRSVGGIRVSLYNAMTIEGAKTLASFMKEFESKYSK